MKDRPTLPYAPRDDKYFVAAKSRRAVLSAKIKAAERERHNREVTSLRVGMVRKDKV